MKKSKFTEEQIACALSKARPSTRAGRLVAGQLLADRSQFRALTVVDQWSRPSPLLEAASRMSGRTVGAALDRVLVSGPTPRSITVDHGTQFMSRALEDWAYQSRRAARFHSTRQPRGERLH